MKEPMKIKRLFAKIITVVCCLSIVLTLTVLPCFALYGYDYIGDTNDDGQVLPNSNLGLPWYGVYTGYQYQDRVDIAEIVATDHFGSFMYNQSTDANHLSSTAFGNSISFNSVEQVPSIKRSIYRYDYIELDSTVVNGPWYSGSNTVESFAYCLGNSYNYIRAWSGDDTTQSLISLYDTVESANSMKLDGGRSFTLYYDGVIDVNVISPTYGRERYLPEMAVIDFFIDGGKWPNFFGAKPVISARISYKVGVVPFSTSVNITPINDYISVNTGLDNELGSMSSAYNEVFDMEILRCNLDLNPVWNALYDAASSIPKPYINDLNIEFCVDTELNSGVLFDNPFLLDYIDEYDGYVPIVQFSLTGNHYNYDAVRSISGNYYGDLTHGNEPYVSIVSMSDFSLTDWLGETLGGVMSTRIIGPITIGSVLYVAVGVGFVMLVLKFFAGG